MLEELRKLQKLQNFDSQIFEKEDELDNLPVQNDDLHDQITELQQKLLELKNSISIQEEEKKKRQEILDKGEDKLKGITGKQSAIRNKEEYNALLREIDNIKRFNKELEEEINEINREMDVKTEELNLIEEESNKKIVECQEKIEQNNHKMEELEKEIDKIYETRDVIAKTVRPVILRKYERILQNSPTAKAIAIADNYICGGCNMTLPPQLFNNVLKSEKIEMCPNCQCILIPSEDYGKKLAEEAK